MKNTIGTNNEISTDFFYKFLMQEQQYSTTHFN